MRCTASHLLGDSRWQDSGVRGGSEFSRDARGREVILPSARRRAVAARSRTGGVVGIARRVLRTREWYADGSLVMLADWLVASADVVRNGAAIKVSSSKRGAHGRAVAQRRLRSNQRRVAHDSSESSGSASDDEASTFGEDERSGRARRSTRGSDDDGDSESDEAFIDDEDDADRFDDTEHGDSDGELEVVGVFSGTKQLSAHEQLDALQPVVIHWRFVVLVLAMLVALAVPSAWHLLEFDSVAEFEARHTIHELEAPFLFVCAACGLFSLLLVAHDSGAHSVTWAKIKLE